MIGRADAGAGRSPLGRAHRSLGILIAVSVLSAGALSLSLGAPPSPAAGIGFGLSALVLAAALTLAARVTIALERARRMNRPAAAANDSFPVLSRLVRRPGTAAPKPNRQ